MGGEPPEVATAETRKLAAIMFTDMVGFSRQIGSAEARTRSVRAVHNQNLAVAYSELGQEGEARTEAEEVLRISPNFSLEVLWKRLPFKNPAGVEHLFAAARKAGLK
jgi:class 3 adenylate cyclase